GPRSVHPPRCGGLHGRLKPRTCARSQVSVFGAPRLAEVEVFGRVLGRDHDRGAPRAPCAVEGESAVVTDLGDRPPVAVADPGPSRAEAAVVAAKIGRAWCRG